uniref:Uncharacterized protein n=1 Tax=Arundo donax TaxID=35708 RepID=A0A0A9DAJ5_ARUDO
MMRRNSPPPIRPARRRSWPSGTGSRGSTRSSPPPSSAWARASSSARCSTPPPPAHRSRRSSACASTSGRRGSGATSRATGPCGARSGTSCGGAGPWCSRRRWSPR